MDLDLSLAHCTGWPPLGPVIGSMSEGGNAGDPARGTPAGAVPAAGAQATDELGALGGPTRGAPAGPIGSMSEWDTAGAGDPGC